MLLLKTPLAIKVVFEECNVGLALLRLGEELVIGRNGHRRCLHLSPTETHRIWPSHGSGKAARTHLFDNALPGADGVPIVELVLGKVELGYFGSVLNLVDRSLKLGLAEGHEKGSGLGRRIWEGDNRGLC
jgi:hypothetical protein